MTQVTLGKLEKVEMREIFENEATDFTPWLAKQENIDRLGELIGMDLVVESEEKEVGPFRADILCKNISNDELVLIENQLEKTDHKHLGQLLTYATGLKAVNIVWISTNFVDEHRATLDWLNTITTAKYNFFGVQAALHKIGNSLIAPQFTIVSKPNDWSKDINSRSDEEDIGPSRKKYLQFWKKLSEKVKSKGNSPLEPKESMPRNYQSFWLHPGCNLAGVFSGRSKNRDLCAEIYIPDNKDLFKTLEKEKDAIEKKFCEELTWEPLEYRKASRIAVYKSNFEIDNEASWDENIDWLILKLEKLHYVFNERLKNLQ
jgi:hypothetical protein